MPPGPCWPGTRTCPGTLFPPFPLWGGKGSITSRLGTGDAVGPYISHSARAVFLPPFPSPFGDHGRQPFVIRQRHTWRRDRRTGGFSIWPDLVGQDRRHDVSPPDSHPALFGVQRAGRQAFPWPTTCEQQTPPVSTDQVTADRPSHHQPASSLHHRRLPLETSTSSPPSPMNHPTPTSHCSSRQPDAHSIASFHQTIHSSPCLSKHSTLNLCVSNKQKHPDVHSITFLPRRSTTSTTQCLSKHS